jgi:hypothetical protein
MGLRLCVNLRYSLMDLPDSLSASPEAARPPTNGLKLMLAIVLGFALVAMYGQWRDFRRPKLESARILPDIEGSPSPLPSQH